MTGSCGITRVVGVLRDVGAPVDGKRGDGIPPGGPRVRRAVWTLNRAAGRPWEAVVHELAGVARLVPVGPTRLLVWAEGRVEARHLDGPTELRGDPVTYWIELPDEVAVVLPAAVPTPGVVDVLAGPDLDVLRRDALRHLVATAWGVSPVSNRVGTRLVGPALVGATARLPTSPMTRGAVEVPPDGQPVVLGPDHPVTGGYPLVAVVPEYACDDLACIPVGGAVSFRLVDVETSRERRRAWWAMRG